MLCSMQGQGEYTNSAQLCFSQPAGSSQEPFFCKLTVLTTMLMVLQHHCIHELFEKLAQAFENFTKKHCA